MGAMIHFPRPRRHVDTEAPVPPDVPLDQATLRLQLRFVESRGAYPVATVIRRPFVGELTTVSSPEDPNTTFDIKRCSVADNIRRQNQSSTVRYAQRQRGGDDEIVTERDFPVGDMQMLTLELGLAGWNITDEAGAPIPVSRVTIQQYLSPREFSFVYDEVIKVNPMWGNGGEEETKKA